MRSAVAHGRLRETPFDRHSKPLEMGETDVEQAVHDAMRSGEEAWPGLTLTREQFTAWVQARGIALEALRARGGDLYLAAACGTGDRRAFELFDRAFLQAPGPRAGSATLSPEQLDELRQRLRVRLLTGPTPRVATFQGNGPLGAWVRVAAARMAVDLMRDERPGGQRDSALVDALVDAGANPELVMARQEHQAEFKEALEDCIASLGARAKTLLRMTFVDKVSIDEIGVVYRVHRATVARWLVAIRREVFECLCKRLSIKLQSSPSEVASLVRLVRSRVDLSLARLLGEESSSSAKTPSQRRDKAGGD
jgi:RNA polymerase sigma-70 factor, ECF subfamily